jgi:hypothetical protein
MVEDFEPNPHRRAGDLVNLFRENLLAIDLQDTFVPHIIDSGRGYQVWCQHHAIMLRDTDKPQDDLPSIHRMVASGMLKAVANDRRLHRGPTLGTTIDTSVAELSRVARLPGTINQKTKRMAEYTRVGDVGPSPLQFLFEGEIPKYEQTLIRAGREERISDWRDIFSFLSEDAQRFITKGWTYPGRHEKCWHTAKSLAEQGASVEAVSEAIEIGAGLSNPPLHDYDWKRIVHQVAKEII